MIFYRIIFIPFCFSLAGCEVTIEISLLSSKPEQGVPKVGLEIGTSSTSLDTAEVRPRVKIPSPMSPIGKSLLISLPMRHNMGGRLMERGEPSSWPSLLFAKKVLKSVLGSWIKTLSSDHLNAGFGMIKHVQKILSKSEGVSLDVTGTRVFVDDIIALGSKWIETENSRMMISSGRCF